MSRIQNAGIFAAIHRFNPALLLFLMVGIRCSLSAALPAARDTTFQTLPMDGIANAAVLLPDGKLLIGGTFQTIGGVSRPALARLNSNGSLDAAFAPPIGGPGAFGKATLTDLAVLPDGKILAAGSPAFRTTGSVLRTNIIRFNPDGSVDAGFDARDLSFWRGLAVHADGRAVISMTSAMAPFRPVRLTTSGSIDPTFNYPNAFQSGAFPLQFNAQADGKTLVVFGDSDPNRNGIQQLSRLNLDGTLDGTFKFGASLQSLTDDSPVALGADGRILVTLSDALSGGGPVVTRLAADGTRDASFAWTGAPNAQRLYPVGAAFLPDGGVIAVRQPTAGDRRLSFFYLTATGDLTATRDLPNSAFDNGVVGLGTISARAFVVQPDGRLLFAAGFLDGGQNIFGMFRLPAPPVPAPPVITVQPLSLAIGAGDFLNLSVTATSESPMTYRWYHNSTNLFPAQTNAFLGLSNTSEERSGEFFVVISNAFGSVTSAVATITVRAPSPMVITRQPQGGAVRLSQSYNLLVQFQTEVNAGYQWFKNGVALPNGGGLGFGSASLNLPANDTTRAGDYQVVITNSFGGSVTSEVAHIDLILPGPPQFTVQPQDISIFASQPVLLSAMALGDGIPAYRWMHEGTNLVAGSDIPSVTGTNLSISARRSDRFGSYALVATLTPGGTTTSRVAVVSLLPSGPPILVSQPPDLRIGIGDRTNLQAGFNAEAPVTIFWQRAGTNLLTQTFSVLDAATTNFLTVLGVPTAGGDYRFIASNRFGMVTSRVATVSIQTPPGAEIRRDLADVTAMLGEYNTTSLSNGLVAINCCGNIETTHILALTPNGGTPPFPVEGTWHLGVGASNRFYVGAQSGFPTVTSSWSYVPGAAGFTGIWSLAPIFHFTLKKMAELSGRSEFMAFWSDRFSGENR